ncbi:glycosyltransferase family 39 protein [Kribbella sp. HUAS MG21]|uniref:Glycosyltransferase family 39 protein n=1 Tax=Kribbella sp. HUAS MG21 TaxID=3160966 RepID=A0AAU7T4U7_9ACTN
MTSAVAARPADDPTTTTTWWRRHWAETTVVLAVLVVLAATSNAYGYHRDELYFLACGKRLAWGYPDQPPLTPLLAVLGDAISPGSLWALRLPATLMATASVVFVILIAAEMGATRRARVIAALTVATSAAVLMAGHLLMTNTTDFFFAALLSWLLARYVRTRAPRLLLILGVVLGVGLLNKTLLGLLALALVIGVLIAGPRTAVRSRYFVAGALAATLIAAPNFAWQLAHGLPQLAMAESIQDRSVQGGRLGVIPFQLVLVSPLLVPIWVAGLVRLLRPNSFRLFGVAYVALAAELLVLGGNGFYLAGAYPALLAAGAIATDRWLTTVVRRRVLAGVFAGSAALVGASGLPLVPAAALADVPLVRQLDFGGTREQFGWPELTATVAGVYDGLPEEERARAVIVAGNYGQAAALERYGPAYGLPAVYSGNNAYASWGRPPEEADVVIVLGAPRDGRPLEWTRSACRSLTMVGRTGNAAGIWNSEAERPVWLCRGPDRSWEQLWPTITRLA